MQSLHDKTPFALDCLNFRAYSLVMRKIRVRKNDFFRAGMPPLIGAFFTSL